jgi:hypothetical protein
MAHLLRAAALTNDVDVARQAALDPRKPLSRAGISQSASMIFADALRDLPTASACTAGVEDFGLRVAETRQLTDLGPPLALRCRCAIRER